MREALGVGLLLAASTTVVAVAQPLPAGAPFQVNGDTSGPQELPAVATVADGGFVVVWEGYSPGDGPGFYSIQGRRFAPDGSPAGPQFRVDDSAVDDPGRPAVAAIADGGFVVVWESSGSGGSDTSGWSVQARRFAADGDPAGAQFQVNSYTTGAQAGPDVAASGDGGFVVVWSSDGSDGGDTSSLSVQGQRFSGDGSPAGAQFQVNSRTTNHQTSAAVASDSDGGFLVAWTDLSEPWPVSWNVRAQRFAAGGVPEGPEFLVSEATPYRLSDAPDVAASDGGGFVVAWARSEPGPGYSLTSTIQGRRYSADGDPAGPPFRIDGPTTGLQADPRLAAAGDGRFVVAWTSYGPLPGDPDRSVQGRGFAADDSPLGPQFQVNTYTSNHQQRPAVASTPAGELVVAWQSYGSDGTDTSGWSIQGRRYRVALFADGFEDGTPAAWSDVLP
jgi:hypothetical protein